MNETNPLSLNRIKALPPGATIVDARDRIWTRMPADSRGRPGWWRSSSNSTASSETIHRQYRPVTLQESP